MKTILFIRHAKSSWDSPTLSDFDRSLNERGKKDAPLVGKEILSKSSGIDLVLCSPSKRTTETCQLLFENSLPLKYIKELYHPSINNVLDAIYQLDNTINTVAIISHNPSITELCNNLQSDARFINIPTCGCVSISFEVENWQEIDKGKLNFYIFPNKDKNYLLT